MNSIPSTSVLHSSSLKTTGETNICSSYASLAKHAKMRQNVLASNYFHCIPLNLSSCCNVHLQKKHRSCVQCDVSSQPTLVIINSRIQLCLTQRAAQTVQYGPKKRNEHNTVLYPRTLAQMPIQIISNPV